MNKEAAVAVATELAQRITAAFPEVSAVCLGGSIAYAADTVDSFSDLDIFVYWHAELCSPDEFAARWSAAFGTRTPVRRREYFLEHRHLSHGLDIDLKHMTVDRVRRFASQEPNLDELYLEKIHSLYHYLVLAEVPGSELRTIIDRARARLTADALGMAGYALETYGKQVYSAIKQGVLREEPMAAEDCFDAALHTLVQLAYLQSGQWPPPYKWRLAATRGACLPEWDSLHDAVAELRAKRGEPLVERLITLRKVERAVAGGYRRPPWSAFTGDHWWWAGLRPLLGNGVFV
ncbi:hypothetical protein [Amycolatopsis sp. NPDC021455]|uniref:hypothetical protein n=1 Tax=Amycolatopsis sp. NPDC021455 TaxID=3154901 RepID=UPI0033CB3AF9